MTTLTQDQLDQLHSLYSDTSGDREVTGQRVSNATPDQLYQSLTSQGTSPDQANILSGQTPSTLSNWTNTEDAAQKAWAARNPDQGFWGGLMSSGVGPVILSMVGGAGLMGAFGGAGAAAGEGMGAAVDPMVYGGTGAGTWGAGDAAAISGGLGATGNAVDPMMYGGTGASTWGAGDTAALGGSVGSEVDPMMYGGGDAGTYGAGGAAGATGAGGYQYGNGFDPSLQTGNPADIGPPSNLAPYQYGNGYDPSQSTGNPANVGPPSSLAPPPTGTGGMPGGTGTPSIPPGAIPGSGSGTGGTGTGGSGLGSLLGLLGGAYGMNQQNQASQQMLDYLKQRQQMNDNMYNPGSPEFNYLWDQMSRNDAAAGRNSQYGPRSVDLAARVAQLKMDANTKMTTGIGNLEANAINQGSNSYLNMLPGLMGLTGGSGTSAGGGSLSDITNWLSKNFNTGSSSYGSGFDPSQITTNPGDIGPPIG